MANFFACLSPNLLVNCTELTQEDVDVVRKLKSFLLSLKLVISVICISDPELCAETVITSGAHSC